MLGKWKQRSGATDAMVRRGDSFSPPQRQIGMADSFHGRGGSSAACAADPVGAGVTDTSIAQATCVASASPTANAAAAEAEDELDLYGDIESTPQLPSEHELRTRLRTIQVRMARRLHHQRPLPTASAFPFSLCASSRLTQKTSDRRIGVASRQSSGRWLTSSS